MASKQLKTLGNVEINPVVDNPLPSPAGEQYKKILINDNETVKWDKEVDFGTGSSLELLKPQMLVSIPEDFDQIDNQAKESTLAWVTAPPSPPDATFAAHAPIGTKKYYNLKATVEDNTHYTFPEFKYGWEETQNIPDPNDENNPASDGDVLTYNGNTDEIVWTQPQGAGAVYTVNSYAPTNADIRDQAYTLNLTNKTLNYIDLSNINFGGGHTSDFEYIDLKLPSIESGEYIDIVIQITKPGEDDFVTRVYDASNNRITNCINLTGDVKSYDSYIGEKKLQIHILGQFYTLSWVGDIEMQGGGGGD